MRLRNTLTLVSVLIGLLVACSSNTSDPGDSNKAGNPAKGESLFMQITLGEKLAPGCITCHSVEPGKTMIGPSMAGIAGLAREAIPGINAEQYLRIAIMNPDEHLADGFPPGIMYLKYSEDLTQEQVNDLVAYILTLK